MGEDLGTVPPIVRRLMDAHGLGRMYVLQFSVGEDAWAPIMEPQQGVVASLNTHDTPTFTAFWHGLDIDDRVAMGLFTEAEGHDLHAQRGRIRQAIVSYFRRQGEIGEGEELPQVFAACLRSIARSRAAVILVNLEDLWGERLPQNTPGTHRERPNWRRRAAVSLESIIGNDAYAAMLREVDRLRRAR